VSAVIYAAIVVMWAVVLVPMWLRRHDDKIESRSVDRFSTAMRTLSRRSHATPGRRYVVMPRREAGSLSVHVSGASAPSAQRTRTAAGRPSSRSTIVARRRRTFLGLIGLAALAFLLAVVGVLPWLLQVFFDLALAGFVWHLRAQARRAPHASSDRVAGTGTAPVSRQRRRDAVAPVARPQRAAPAVPVEPIIPAAMPATVDVTWTTESTEVAATSDDDAATWEPVPVPPPTYTLKPPAPAAAATEPTAPRADDDAPTAPTDLDEILEHRWAVND